MYYRLPKQAVISIKWHTISIRHPVCAVFLFKAALQVEVGIVRREHHRIVDVCPVNGNPPRHIVVA